MPHRPLSVLFIFLLASFALAENPPLPTGRDITPPTSFTEKIGSLPINLALTPDKKYAVTTDAGYRQSLHLVRLADAKSRAHLDYPNNPPAGSHVGEDVLNPILTTSGLYYGLAVSDDNTIYAAQGANDTIAVISLADKNGTPTLTPKAPIKTREGDFPSGLALDSRNCLYVANQASGTNDDIASHSGSIAIYDTKTSKELGRYSFTNAPFATTNYPLALAVMPDGSKLYVASERDSAVYVLNVTDPARPRLTKKIPTGSHPSALLFTRHRERLFVANADSDSVSIISTADNTGGGVTETINLRPDVARDLPGASPLSLALSPDESRLYVALADMNAIAVIDLPHSQLLGYIPTGWYPSAIALASESKLLVLNAKGSAARIPNGPPNRHSPLFLLEGQAQILNIPGDLKSSTEQVLKNNHYNRLATPIPEPLASITKKSGKITHVIYIIKENRTYDQLFGDLKEANSDPKLCIFPETNTPNHHALARRFGILDNLYACGEVSGDGWNWSTESMANPYVVRNVPYHYSHRGRPFDFEGLNNGYFTGGFPAKGTDGKPLSTLPALENGLPPVTDVAQAPGGHLWDLAAAHNVPFRNYGMYVHGSENYPTVTGLQPADHDLAGKTDLDFPRFLLEFPDSDAPAALSAKTGNPAYLSPIRSFGKFNAASRYSEWKREFSMMLERGAGDKAGATVPNLMLIRLPNNHTHGLKPSTRAPAGYLADNDYAVGQIVDAVSHSAIWPHCAIFIIEDDAQDGPDHVDCHRTVGMVVSPYLAKGNVDHNFYNTNSFLRTMEVLLDLPPMTQYDATATLISNWIAAPDNFDAYTAIMPDPKFFLKFNPKKNAATSAESRRLAEASEKMDFNKEDAADAQLLNEMIWKSVRGPDSPMPTPRTTHLVPITKPKDND